MKTRSIWTLNENERAACTTLSRMKSTDNVRFDNCEENDRIYDEAKDLLNGEDPIAFAIEMLTELHGESMRDYFTNQYAYYLDKAKKDEWAERIEAREQEIMYNRLNGCC